MTQLKWQLWIALLVIGIVGNPFSAKAQTPMPPVSAPLPKVSPSSAVPLLQSVSVEKPLVPTAQSGQYPLGAGDQIQITVANYEEVTGQRTVMPDGSITLPLLGSIKVIGLTTEGLARQLQVRWNKFLINPLVTVNLTSLRPVVVSVAGEVQRPGPRKFEGGDGKANLMAAIAAAGGITRNADISKVLVKRRTPQGGDLAMTFNLWEVVNADRLPEDLTLQDGDTISIPRLEGGSTLDRRLIARSSLAANTVRVRVVGEVTRPGEVQVPPDGSLSSAIAIAGGPTNDAKLSEVNFIRTNDNGQVDRQVLDLRNLSDSQQVQDGDVLIVPKKPVAKALDSVGRVFGPLNFLLRLFTGF